MVQIGTATSADAAERQNERSPAPTSPPQPVMQPTIPNVEGIFGDVTSGGSGNSAKAKAAALRGVDIEKRRLDFQKKTGLRDIEQARDEGIRGAINNALQRGIYRSGIRIENESKVNREADEAKGDLTQDIAFALELLKNRADQIRAGGGGGGVSGFGFDFGEFNALIDMISRFGVVEPTPTIQPGQGAPGYGSRTGSGSRF